MTDKAEPTGKERAKLLQMGQDAKPEPKAEKPAPAAKGDVSESKKEETDGEEA